MNRPPIVSARDLLTFDITLCVVLGTYYGVIWAWKICIHLGWYAR